jgi:RNA polymerase sigma-B factor
MLDTAIAPRKTALASSRSRRDRQDALLFERYHRTRDQHVRAELVSRLLPLAKRLTRRYANSDEYDDLVQVASFALITAIDRYDPRLGLRFSTFAVPTIVGALKRYFRDHCWSVRVPRELHDVAIRAQRASEGLTARLGRSPTPAELAEALECSVELVLEALETASAQHPDRLDAPTCTEDDEGSAPTVAIEEPGYAIAEASATLAPLLARLTPTEHRILKLRFEHDLTQSEIGDRVLADARLACPAPHHHFPAAIRRGGTDDTRRRLAHTVDAITEL